MILNVAQERAVLLLGEPQSALSGLHDAYLPYIAMTLNNFGHLYCATQSTMEAEKVCGEMFRTDRKPTGPDRDRAESRPQIQLRRLKTIYRDADRKDQYG
jgi:hypothetical protein